MDGRSAVDGSPGNLIKCLLMTTRRITVELLAEEGHVLGYGARPQYLLLQGITRMK